MTEGNARMQKALSTFRKSIVSVYLAVAACMLVIVVLVFGQHQGFQADYGLGEYTDIDGVWVDENGQPANLSELEAKNGMTSIYWQLPQMEQDTSLVYCSQSVYTKVYLEENLIYETDSIDLSSYNKSPGSCWNIVRFSPKQAGQQVELQVIEVYAGERLSISHMYWGDRAAIVLSVIREKLTAVLVSVTICLVGLFIILLDIPVNLGKKRKNHGLRYLGFFSLCIGLWCLFETKIPQFFIMNSQLIQVLDNMLLILSVLPMVLFADWTYGILKYRLVRIMCVLHLLFLVGCVAAPIAGISDWHGMLPIARFFMAVCAAGFVVWVVWKNFSIFIATKKRRSARLLAGSLQLLGIGALGLAAILELVRFNAVDDMDNALLLRFGLLIFIICFALSSQFSTYHLISQGMEYDSVHELAYSDVLTKLENRTAYLERLEGCVKEHVQELGLVFMDVNNLKVVNDSLGHDMGDLMIQIAAKVINESFRAYGRVFRIGGDEFCVLLEGDVREKYDRALEAFERGILEVNDKNEYSFTIQVAQGFACCEAESMEAVEAAAKSADERMYENKAWLKAKVRSV